ncbi:hypothetical protein PAECIP111894_03740 [Paenibacillus pseudetheri]|uniref:Uncharacterized protein n=1 Tax=Paenibacillus pseudetheri TaxID=2897682 RepID=A0ABM9BF32_9BACL|nr:hypothetical protein PAECIP111894_03740 [Paenibacillus pseudetheri]
MKKLLKPIRNNKRVIAYSSTENGTNFACNIVAGCS